MSVADDENVVAWAGATSTGISQQALARHGAEDSHRRDLASARDGGTLPSRTRLLWVGGFVVAGLVLFLAYLRFSGTQGVTADGGIFSIQAWDMLHGNWLLKGWSLSDVTFYTTELPEYVLVEIFRGLGPQDVHIAGALTYTLIVLLGGLLAKGNKTGKAGLVRVLIAAGIMIAPQVGPGAFLLLEEPDHVGTAVPLLLIFLLLDRAPRRWWVPWAVGLLLVWAQVGDRTVVTMGVLPIVLVCGALAYRDLVQRREPLEDHWFNAAVAASALISTVVAIAVVKIIHSLGGYFAPPLNTTIAPTSSWPANASMVLDGILRLFGASFNARGPGIGTLFDLLHLVGVVLAVWALFSVIRRFFSCDDLIAQILTVAIPVQLALYGFSTLPYDAWQAHDIAVVLPFGAVLAGRVLAERLTKARLLPLLAVVAFGYLVALGHGVVQKQVPAHDQALGPWLRAHHLTAGFSVYSDAGAIELTSGGAIDMTVPWFHPTYVSRRIPFEEQASDWDPRLHYANFVVSTHEYGLQGFIPPDRAIRAFGQPAHTYYVQGWTIMVWNKNLLPEIRQSTKLSGARGGRSCRPVATSQVSVPVATPTLAGARPAARKANTLTAAAATTRSASTPGLPHPCRPPPRRSPRLSRTRSPLPS